MTIIDDTCDDSVLLKAEDSQKAAQKSFAQNTTATQDVFDTIDELKGELFNAYSKLERASIMFSRSMLPGTCRFT